MRILAKLALSVVLGLLLLAAGAVVGSAIWWR